MSPRRRQGSLKINDLPESERSIDIHEVIHVEETVRCSRGSDRAGVLGIVWMFVGVVLIGAGIAWSSGTHHTKDLARKEVSLATILVGR